MKENLRLKCFKSWNRDSKRWFFPSRISYFTWIKRPTFS